MWNNSLFDVKTQKSREICLSLILRGLCFSICILKDKLDNPFITVFIIIPLSFGGILLITQPNIIFGNNTNNLSLIGILCVMFGGISKAACSLIVKKDKYK